MSLIKNVDLKKNIQHALKNLFILKPFFCIVTPSLSIGYNEIFIKILFLSPIRTEGGGDGGARD